MSYRFTRIQENLPRIFEGGGERGRWCRYARALLPDGVKVEIQITVCQYYHKTTLEQRLQTILVRFLHFGTRLAVEGWW
jgi:hypothetical protein